jgi:DNA-binding MarR family transcriptional regulator
MEEMPGTKKIANNIWEYSNYINNCLLSLARKGINNKNGCLFMDSLSHKQGIMLLAVKELNAINPNGSSLKELARHLGITEPSASVMVNTLVKKGVLRRLTSDSDRREVKIKLTETVGEFFFNMDQAIYRQIMNIADIYGEELLLKWQDLLQQLRVALDALKKDG